MLIDDFELIAPGFTDAPWSETQALGCAVWLWMHSKAHRDMPLHALNKLLLPALRQRQFMIGSQQGRPVFYVSWSYFSAEAERRYLDNAALELPEHDWNSGERMWFHDWVAPFGHSTQVARLLQRRFFTDRCMRGLYHRGDERGLQIKQFQGIKVMPAEARAWFATHAVARSA
ncbi:toxin-activating lysine-acyltransferase [Pseudomonas abieticivorans]|uniref:toxin-activating lysine-acyltransferase n=1 Tax=Pseudomonas abieticivorans TaxID=2931382 RepID=UPI0020BEBBCD|nr:toxin-activating lysine-acyltransferase [Pseudomonas sp. PIA16]